jgi:adenosylcobinamide-phosphate synthase
MMNYLTAIILGYVIDLVVGDPYWFPHPVRFIGKLINMLEKCIRKVAKTDRALKIGGVFLLVLTVAITGGVMLAILWALSLAGEVYLFVGQVFFSWLILSTKCLAFEAKMVYKSFDGGIEAARKRVAYIVGRDTESLTEDEIIKATVETVAENTTDGIISPLVYLLIGGPVLGMMFKAASTLDSMVGYKNDKYLYLGWASAKFDDVLNYIPARLTGFIMVVASFICRLDGKSSYKILKRDRRNHKSPNCAWSESAAAGALGIELGGTHNYFGKSVYKPTIGDATREVNKNDILKMNKLMYVTSVISLVVFTAIAWGLV